MGQGFMFTESEVETTPAQNINLNCHACGLFKNCSTPYMEPAGIGRKKILIIGEFPTRHDDRRGLPLCGEEGDLLSQTLEKFGVVIDRDCWRVNAVRCVPHGDKPDNNNVLNCRKKLYKTIEELKPEKIITLGFYGFSGLLGHILSGVSGIASYVGWSIPDQKLKTMVFPTYAPSYVLENRDNSSYRVWFKRHIQNAVGSSVFVPRDNDRVVKVLHNDFDVIQVLDKIMKDNIPTVFDYESTGLKPYNVGHRVLYASVCNGGHSYSFEVTNSVLWTFKEFLTSEVPKIAHNLKYETKWSRKILGVEVQNWYWDTMLGAHILDNRKGITSLKFQTYVNNGIQGYEDKISQYIKASAEDVKKYGSNAFNRMDKAPKADALQYGGEDSLYTYDLYEIQKPLIEERYTQAFDFFMESVLNLSEIEDNGIHADREYYENQKIVLGKKYEEAKSIVLDHPKVPKDFNPGSGPQIAHILYDVMGEKCHKDTKKGGRSTDAEALEAVGTEWTSALLTYKKLDKLVGTYLDGFLREISEDGLLHCNFNLNTVSTYRSSSSDPNFQNIPKRDEESQIATRKGLRAAPGHFLAELDFKGVEVSIACCYNKDQNMIRYVEDPSTDMHRDMGARLFLKPADQITKEERFAAKNGMVFAQFYGSYYKKCGPGVWELIGQNTKDWLRTCGILNVDDFTQHVRTVEDWMWQEMFPDYARWKENNWNQFQKNGYIDYYTGFRVQGPMSMNQANNYPIQGTAFHVLLKTLNFVNSRFHRFETKSFAMGQIHDSMILSVHPQEEQLLMDIVQAALEHIRNEWQWIIVPLTIEYEKAPVDGNWTELKEAGAIAA